MKKILSILLLFSLLLIFATKTNAQIATKNDAESLSNVFDETNLEVKSAILMEAETGNILYAKNEDEMLPPASVTKIMTLLLAAEAIKEEKISLTDMVVISEHAASMGGSQVFLKEGEKLSVEDLLKCTIIASANDAAVALAELICGSEVAFVNTMNNRAKELGMKNTVFENTTGLDDTVTNHLTSSKDIAIMSRELIKHQIILKYSSLWQDYIRDGSFTLTNTNRLVRFYDGCNGLKTGSTDKAGYCISVTAKRSNMQLIAVIMGSPTRDTRNSSARALLDYGFSNFELFSQEEYALEEATIYSGKKQSATIYAQDVCFLVPKGYAKRMEKHFEIPEYINAPTKSYEEIGNIVYKIGDNELGRASLYLKEDISRLSFWDIFTSFIKTLFVE